MLSVDWGAVVGLFGGYIVRVVQAAIVVLVAYVVVKYVGKAVSLIFKVEEHEFLERFVMFFKAVVYAIAILMAISFIAAEPQVFVALLLVVGLGVVAMFSDVLRNVGSELYVRNMRIFKEGDWVEIDGIQGRVSRMNSLGVVLETLRRERVYVPYTKISHTTVVNRMSTYGLSLRLRVKVPKTYDIAKARELVASSLLSVREDLIAEPSVSLRSITESSYVFDVVVDIMNVGKVEKVCEKVVAELKARDPGIDVEF
ncbi:MAG: mechanosensitive ion channel [Sulfolobales archaeon]|nr:mechanosensitive ion channel family protein [Sulfolobales archaeon]MCX8209066.1 mechanosensitive ion channel family protein [Sulfolobales archaeon]MDW8009987.1 mechanosensitive ion channel [Sulfolobales archaeon]